MAGRIYSYAKWKKKIWPCPKKQTAFFADINNVRVETEINQRPLASVSLETHEDSIFSQRENSFSLQTSSMKMNVSLFSFFLCTHSRLRPMIKEMKIEDEIPRTIPRVFSPYAWNILAKYKYTGVECRGGSDRFWVTLRPFTLPNYCWGWTGTQTLVSYLTL